MADEFDPFKGSSALPDDFDGEIQEAWFEFDPEYMDGQQLVIKMKMMTNEESFGGEGTGLGVQLYSCGKDWTVEGRGESAVRRDGRTDKGFTIGSAYDLFIEAAISCPGAETTLRSADRGDPRKAAMWVGTCWHFNIIEHDYGPKIGKIGRLLPTKFLGTKGINSVEAQVQNNAGPPVKAAGPVKAAPSKAAAPTKKAAPSAPAAAAPAAATTTVAFDESHPLWETLYSVAYEAADHESFMQVAFETIAGVAGDTLVEQGVMDIGPSSLWAKAVAAYEAAQ